ncbi:MAG: amino acid ABC transporter permease, partial [Thermoguttaceae bacterium]|nr:amino acid ABC transporter permease [Thermoguttaceae bacterium]
VVVVKRTYAAKTPERRGLRLKNICKELSASFDRTFLRESRWKLIWQGLKVTVLISVLSAILGTVLAFPVCALRRSKNRLWRSLGRVYISLMQGTPILVILMILYYVVFAKTDINAVLVAVIGFGLNFSAYVSEMLRTGIEGIPKGQSEAALALGFSRFAVFRHVILPQAIRRILPVYRGEFINVLKTTSVVGYIAIQDLTKMSDIIRSRTYEAFFPLITTAIIYFVIAWLFASGLTFLEYKLDPNSRKRIRKGGEKC